MEVPGASTQLEVPVQLGVTRDFQFLLWQIIVT